MLELGNIDLATDPLAARYIKTEIVSVEFARSDGELISTEGPNRYRAGDALITGSTATRWSVSRDRFAAKYAPQRRERGKLLAEPLRQPFPHVRDRGPPHEMRDRGPLRLRRKGARRAGLFERGQRKLQQCALHQLEYALIDCMRGGDAAVAHKPRDGIAVQTRREARAGLERF